MAAAAVSMPAIIMVRATCTMSIMGGRVVGIMAMRAIIMKVESIMVITIISISIPVLPCALDSHRPPPLATAGSSIRYLLDKILVQVHL
jgi:hypothetical protein